MKKYVLTSWMFGMPFPQEFRAPDDDSALWFSRGFIAYEMLSAPETDIEKRYRLDEDAANGSFNEETFVGWCRLEERGVETGQIWETAINRACRPKSR